MGYYLPFGKVGTSWNPGARLEYLYKFTSPEVSSLGVVFLLPVGFLLVSFPPILANILGEFSKNKKKKK